MFECPSCGAQYTDPTSARWCADEDDAADRDARRR
ncbi:hypothetical protein DEU31_3071 [Brachybacterium sp. AG952]|nr:hypothetical protein DEU31_3071 [Brachybacterium sp. AG952]